MWAVVTAAETKPSRPVRKWKAPAALMAVNFGWKGKKICQKGKMPWLEHHSCFFQWSNVSLIHCLSLAKALYLILSQWQINSMHYICAILIWSTHKTRPKEHAHWEMHLSLQQQPPIILQVVCAIPVGNGCMHNEKERKKKAVLTEGAYTRRNNGQYWSTKIHKQHTESMERCVSL